jgi:hypothetical protein
MICPVARPPRQNWSVRLMDVTGTDQATAALAAKRPGRRIARDVPRERASPLAGVQVRRLQPRN